MLVAFGAYGLSMWGVPTESPLRADALEFLHIRALGAPATILLMAVQASSSQPRLSATHADGQAYGDMSVRLVTTCKRQMCEEPDLAGRVQRPGRHTNAAVGHPCVQRRQPGPVPAVHLRAQLGRGRCSPGDSCR